MTDQKEFSSLTVRLPREMKQQFEKMCRDKDQTPSQIIRILIRETLKECAPESTGK